MEKKNRFAKMKLAQKLLCMILSLVMVMLLGACGQTGNGQSTNQSNDQSAQNGTGSGEQEDTSKEKEPVTLEWYYRGNGIQKDTQMVEDAINEALKSYEGLEHVTIHMNCFTSADYANSVLLDQTSGRQMDIVNTVGLNFVTEVRNGTFLALDEYLAQMPELQNELPDWLWDLGKVDGSTYMVPNYQRGANMMYMVIPKAYEKYIDIDSFREMLVDKSTPIEDIASVMENFIVALREDLNTETKYLPPLAGYYVNNYGFDQYFDTLSGSFVIYNNDTTVQNLYMTEQFKKACEITADWYEKGYIPQDALVIDNDTLIKSNMLNDVSRAMDSDQGWGDEDFAESTSVATYGFETYRLPFSSRYFMANSWGAGGNGVTASCKHPEEAIKFIEALNTEKGKEIYNLAVFGIEGVHYEKIDETHIKTLEYETSQGGLDTSYAGLKWIIGNTAHAYLNQAVADIEMEMADKINNDPNNIISPIMGFRITTEPVSTELEQTAAVVTEYRDILINGVMGKDWEATYNEFIQKLETAGCAKVIDEFQSQIDGFLN